VAITDELIFIYLFIIYFITLSGAQTVWCWNDYDLWITDKWSWACWLW